LEFKILLLNPNESSKEKMNIAAELINLHTNTLEYLKKMEKAFINFISITMYNGSVKIIKGYRVHHSILRG